MLAVASAHLARQHAVLNRPEQEKTLILAKYRPMGAPDKPLHESTTFIRSTPDAFTLDKSCFTPLDIVGLEDWKAQKRAAKGDDLDDMFDQMFENKNTVHHSHCL